MTSVKTSFMSKVLKYLLLLGVVASCTTRPTLMVDYGESRKMGEPDFQWPVYGAVMTQKFRPIKRSPYRRIHEGIDLAAQPGTNIVAIDHGRVVYAGHGYTGYGRLVIVEHLDKRYRSYYAHLSRYKVERGDIITKGQVVGLMGKSGRATGVHLHFELRRDNLAINPLDHLPPRFSQAHRQSATP